jgi:type II secretory pathway pseudopilin PulG
VKQPIAIRGKKPSEEGYILVAVIFLLFLFALSLTIAAPLIARQIQHDREVETVERGKQYIRAIQLYYRQFHSYPPNIKALLNTNNRHFLRKQYVDPMTGKVDWKPVMFGQNKAPMSMGFFGQPNAGSAIAGVGPGGSGGMSGLSSTGTGTSTGFGSSTSGGFGGGGVDSGGLGLSGGSSLFSSQSTGTGTDAGTSASSGTTGSSSDTTGGIGSTTTGGGTTTGTGTGSGTGLNGQTFGGVGIIGVEPVLDKQSVLVYKTKSRYNQWEFVYDPLSDMRTVSGNSGTVGQSATSLSNSNGTNGTGSQSNGQSGSNSFGGSNTFGGSATDGQSSSPSTTTP